MEEINYDAEGNPMLTWEQAEIKSSSYVKLETDVEKKLTLSQWQLVQKEDRFNPGTQKLYFIAKVTTEDGEGVEKTYESPSARLRSNVAKVLKGLATPNNEGLYVPSTPVELSIIKTGDKMNTNYVVRRSGA